MCLANLAVDIPPWSTRLHRPEVLSLKVLIAVHMQLYRASDIQLRQICSCYADRG